MEIKIVNFYRLAPKLIFFLEVANITKSPGGGLGISLEGTVDIENGHEVRPHHYIRSVLPDGPVDVNGHLRSGDELLEVNCYVICNINCLGSPFVLIYLYSTVSVHFTLLFSLCRSRVIAVR